MTTQQLINANSLMKKQAALLAPDDDEAEGKTLLPGRIRTTLKDFGPKLPIGILDREGNLHRDIVLKPWRTKDDRELGKKISVDTDMADHVSLVVSNMCSRVGPHDLDSMLDAHKSYAVSQMYLADVFYTYALLRMHVIGPDLTLPIVCPRVGCKSEFKYTGDLGTIEVIALEDDIDAILWRFDLKDPVEIKKQHVTHLKLSYPKWGAMEEARGNKNVFDVRAITLARTVVGLNDSEDPVSLQASDLDDLSKRDFEALSAQLDEQFLGPKMAIEGQCSPAVCKKFKTGGFDFNVPLNWSYKSFFGDSSR